MYNKYNMLDLQKPQLGLSKCYVFNANHILR